MREGDVNKNKEITNVLSDFTVSKKEVYFVILYVAFNLNEKSIELYSPFLYVWSNIQSSMSNMLVVLTTDDWLTTTCDDELKVYFDGILQTASELEEYKRVSQLFLSD